jgi:hypothetical protein
VARPGMLRGGVVPGEGASPSRPSRPNENWFCGRRPALFCFIVNARGARRPSSHRARPNSMPCHQARPGRSTDLEPASFQRNADCHAVENVRRPAPASCQHVDARTSISSVTLTASPVVRVWTRLPRGQGPPTGAMGGAGMRVGGAFQRRVRCHDRRLAAARRWRSNGP